MATRKTPPAERKPDRPETPAAVSWDHRLRSHGFAIAGRPRKGPALWRRNGETVTEAEAMRRVMAEETPE